MKIGIKVPNIFDEIFEEISNNKSINEILINLILKRIYFSDLLFLILKKLKEDKKIEVKKNKIYIIEKIDENYLKNLKEYFSNEVKKFENKIFFSPLDISKFYQCERRFYLEKFLNVAQKKSKKSYEGEIIHFAIKEFFKNYLKYDIDEIAKNIKKKYKINEGETKIKEHLNFLYTFLRKNKFNLAIPEFKIVALKKGIFCSLDLIAIKGNEVYPIEIKLSFRKKFSTKLQLIGQAIALENYLRKKIDKVILIGLNTKKYFIFKISESEKLKFYKYLKKIKKVILSDKLPKIKQITLKKNVCKYCHVKEVCEKIEKTKKLIK